MTDEADKSREVQKARDPARRPGRGARQRRGLKSRDRGSDRGVISIELVGLIVGLKAKAGVARLAKWLILLMSRAGLEPATHWLKASSEGFE